LAPEIDVERWLSGLRESNARLDNVLALRLPKRFAQQWCEAHGVAMPLAQLGADRLSAVAAGLHRWSVMPSGTLGYNKAEVTIGGVDTRNLSSKTMAVHDVGGLFFIGEVVDVTGWLGGYNFQWAWASGYAAGMAA
jgi:predicted flavoprotein YhiN